MSLVAKSKVMKRYWNTDNVRAKAFYVNKVLFRKFGKYNILKSP